MKVKLVPDGKRCVTMSAILTVASVVFFAEQLSIANLALLFLLIGAHVVVARREMARELSVTCVSYFARVAIKEKRARVMVTSSTAKA